MKIALASDVHFEFYKNEPDWVPEIVYGCDVIVLALISRWETKRWKRWKE